MSVQAYLNSVLPSKEVLLGINSFLRNSFSAMQVCPRFIKVSGVISGAASLLDAKMIANETSVNFTQAEETDDVEGLRKAKIDEIKGIFSGFLGIGQLGSYLTPISLGAFGLSSVTLGFCFSILGGASSLFLSLANIISVYYEWGNTSLFRANLKEILQKNLPQKEKTLEALEFLGKQLVLTLEEEREILAQPELTPEIQAVLFQNKVLSKTKSLIRAFGETTARDILMTVDLLIESVQMDQDEALIAAQEFIQKIDQESFKHRVQQVTTLVITVLGTVGTIFAFALTGPVSPILFAATALLLLSSHSNWLREHIGNLFYTPFEIEQDMPAIEMEEVISIEEPQDSGFIIISQ